MFRPFAPSYGTNQNLSATTTPQEINLLKGDKSVRIMNTGSQTLYVVIGQKQGRQVATTDLLVRASTEIIISKAEDDIYLSYRSGSSTTTASVMTGQGGV